MQCKTRFLLKKINLLPLVVFLLFFLTACGGTFDFLDAEMNRAVGKKDPKVCLKMNEEGDENRKKRCLVAVAEEKKDPKVCDLIDDDEDKDYCVRDVGIAMMDSSVCEGIKDKTSNGPIGSCYLRVAEGTKNEALCIKIPNETVRANCLLGIANEKSDENICAMVEDVGIAANCFYDVAKAKDDVEICKSIVGDEEEKGYCYSYFAEKRKDESLCLEIEAGKARDDCYKDVALLIDGDLLCNKIQDIEVKSKCIYDIAFKRLDANMCSRIEDKYTKKRCYKQIALETSDSQACQMLDSITDMSGCLREIAEKNKSSEVCIYIDNNDYLQYKCCYAAALAGVDASQCELLKDKERRDKCIHEISRRFHEGQACVKLQYPSEKESCMTSSKANQ